MPRSSKLNSQQLKNHFKSHFKEDTELKEIDKDLFEGYQAHHIIPAVVLQGYGIPEDELGIYNLEWNCLLVANYDDAIIHNGSHPSYNDFVTEFLNVFMEVFKEDGYPFSEIAKGVADIIRDDFNDALSRERIIKLNAERNNEDFAVKSMDDFANTYLWNVYFE